MRPMILLVLCGCGCWALGVGNAAGPPAPVNSGQEPAVVPAPVSAAAVPAKADASRLVGTWRVDLRSKPGDAPYYQQFVVKSVVDNTPVGTFYDSEIRDARLNLDWGTVHFAFTTADAHERGTYNTTGRLVGDRIEGTTHSLGRHFLAVWTAVRLPEP